VVSAWLYQVARRTAIDVVRREAGRQIREQIAVELTAMNAPTADWTAIEPLLDEAMHALDQTDRTAVLLRYFESRSLREVGLALGTSEDAAQKRVTRAVSHLREWFAQRGVKVAAGGFGAVISAHAIQAAPAGLAASISTAAAPAGLAAISPALATAALTLAMTTFQKSLIAVAFLAAVGFGTYYLRHLSGTNPSDQADRKVPELAALKGGMHTQDQEAMSAASDNSPPSKASADPAAQPGTAAVSSGAGNASLGNGGGGFGGQNGRFSNARRSHDELYSQLGLSPVQADAFTALLLNRQDAIGQAIALAPKETLVLPFHSVSDLSGITLVPYATLTVSVTPNEPGVAAEVSAPDKSDWPQRIAAAIAPTDAQIKAIFGDAALAAYQEFDDRASARGGVNRLQDQLPDDPLSPDRKSRLIELLVTANPQFSQNKGSAGAEARYWNTLTPEMVSLLTPDQLATLESDLENSNRAAKKMDDAIAAAKAAAKG
jgi:hypothetical protein